MCAPAGDERLGSQQTTVREYTYSYDRFGNRWQQDLTGGSGFDSEFSFASASNRLTTSSFTYDGSGNQATPEPGSPTLTYSQENRLTGVSGGPQYVVDAQGRRVQRTFDSVTTDYFYLGATVIAEKTGSAWTDYIFPSTSLGTSFGGQRIAQNTGTSLSTTKFLHPDHLGSTRVCTDGSGDNGPSGAWTCHYEPFGEFRAGSTCSDNPANFPTTYRFAGMQWDEDAGRGCVELYADVRRAAAS